MPDTLVCPMPLVRIPEAFDDPAWVFELKYDGFRALAFIEGGSGRLVSRNGHTFRQFSALADSLVRVLPAGVYDGEIVCLDDEGCPRFNALMFRRSSPVFAAFDVLWLAGQDLKVQPLLERKRRLAAVVPARSRSLLFVQHLEARGTRLFGKVCEQDLEGVVGKWAKGRYVCDGQTTSWVKVKNPAYSQAVGRHELFEGRSRGVKARPKPRRLVLA